MPTLRNPKHEEFRDPIWRISNLYQIRTREGKVIPFRPSRSFAVLRAFVVFANFFGVIYRESLSLRARWGRVCGPTLSLRARWGHYAGWPRSGGAAAAAQPGRVKHTQIARGYSRDHRGDDFASPRRSGRHPGGFSGGLRGFRRGHRRREHPRRDRGQDREQLRDEGSGVGV